MTTQNEQKKSEEKSPDAKTEAFKAAIEADLVEFDRRKEALLASLRAAHKDGPKSEPFNEDKWSYYLTDFARIFFWQARVKQETMPVADRDREARLRELAKALGKARGMADKAMQDDVGNDLFSAWWEGTDEPLSMVRDDDGSIVLVRTANEMFKEAVTGLAALETAARLAASEARKERTRRGRARRRTVPPDCIDTLWVLYRESTGVEPGAGYGPFVRFAGAFLDAMRANVSEEYVVELAQKARYRAHANKGELSPFDD
jgi:hypothetical protein